MSSIVDLPAVELNRTYYIILSVYLFYHLSTILLDIVGFKTADEEVWQLLKRVWLPQDKFFYYIISYNKKICILISFQ